MLLTTTDLYLYTVFLVRCIVLLNMWKFLHGAYILEISTFHPCSVLLCQEGCYPMCRFYKSVCHLLSTVTSYISHCVVVSYNHVNAVLGLVMVRCHSKMLAKLQCSMCQVYSLYV